jgi:endonuclease-3
MLSAQTTDVNVNRVTERLFEKYRRPEDYLAVPQEELERDVYATGFFRQKAKSIRGTMRVLLEEFDGEVPRTIDELLRLPGVARKTANVVLPSSVARRESSWTPTCAGSRSASG